MKSFLAIPFLLILLIGCNVDTKVSYSVEHASDSLDTADLVDPGPMNYYLLDKFAEAPFEAGELTPELLRSLFPNRLNEQTLPMVDSRSSVDADSMLTITLGEDRLVFYVNERTPMLYYGRLVDNAIAFKNDVRIGMDKASFAQKFDQLKLEDDLPAVIQIANPDNREVYNFIFYEDTLGMVIYDSYIE